MNRLDRLNQLRNSVPAIAPSLLKCDFSNLQGEISRLQEAGSPVLHWDVMDGRFVPNLSYGAMVIERCRPLTSQFFDAHLMISDPAQYLDGFLKAGCDGITFHIEAVPDPVPLLQKIRAAGRVAGLALNPGTPFESIQPFLSDCDLVLVMSVEPGFGGQKFIPSSLEKLFELKLEASKNLLISIDGGIDLSTIGQAAAAGAGLFVAGSAIFDKPDYAEAVDGLRQAAWESMAM